MATFTFPDVDAIWGAEDVPLSVLGFPTYEAELRAEGCLNPPGNPGGSWESL